MRCLIRGSIFSGGRHAHEAVIGIASAFLMLTLAVAALAPWIAPHDFATQNLARRLRPPEFWGGDWTYPLGTDNLGRDILSRLIFGVRTSIAVAIAGTLIGATLGTMLGYVAARLRGSINCGEHFSMIIALPRGRPCAQG